MTRAYGWRPDLPDKRDSYHVPRLFLDQMLALPESHDNSASMPAAWDQGGLGACTMFALCGAASHEMGFAAFDPSFLHGYYCVRAMEGTISEDAGASIRDICKMAATYGIAYAPTWPYREEKFAIRPPKAAYRSALKCRVSSYARVGRGLEEIKAALYGKDCIVFGATLYESFDTESVARHGMVPLPGIDEDILGGHALCIVGYDDNVGCFKVRNSWGSDWGHKGHCWMPYDYITDRDLCDDFWVIKAVTP
jgi:hypothetical protein